MKLKVHSLAKKKRHLNKMKPDVERRKASEMHFLNKINSNDNTKNT
jgi:hypothetical protein